MTELEERRAYDRENHRRWREANKERWRTQLRKASRKRSKLPEPTRPETPECECCGKVFTADPHKGATLDHCHKTGKFRGWLCGCCNRAIGKLGDDLQGVQRAISYLKRFEETLP